MAEDAKITAGEQLGWTSDDLPRCWENTVNTASLAAPWGAETSEHPQEVVGARLELQSCLLALLLTEFLCPHRAVGD